MQFWPVWAQCNSCVIQIEPFHCSEKLVDIPTQNVDTIKLYTFSELLGFGLRPSSGILGTRKNNVSETASVFVLR
jgi:hypothetical protein